METIRTPVQVRQLYREMKASMTYATFQDFIARALSRLGLSIYINGVVVFANDEARLSIHNATVAILRPNDLVLFLREYASSRVFDEREIEQVSQALEPYSHHHAR